MFQQLLSAWPMLTGVERVRILFVLFNGREVVAHCLNAMIGSVCAYLIYNFVADPSVITFPLVVLVAYYLILGRSLIVRRRRLPVQARV